MDLEKWNDPGLWIDYYDDMALGTVFFAEGIYGDQFGIRGQEVVRFEAETSGSRSRWRRVWKNGQVSFSRIPIIRQRIRLPTNGNRSTVPFLEVSRLVATHTIRALEAILDVVIFFAFRRAVKAMPLSCRPRITDSGCPQTGPNRFQI